MFLIECWSVHTVLDGNVKLFMLIIGLHDQWLPYLILYGPTPNSADQNNLFLIYVY